jgi:hypothetical protein
MKTGGSGELIYFDLFHFDAEEGMGHSKRSVELRNLCNV